MLQIPVKKFCDVAKSIINGQLYNDSGIVPVSELSNKIRFNIWVIFNKQDGIGPDNEFTPSWMLFNEVRLLKKQGM